MNQSNKATGSLLSRYSAYKNSILKKVSVAAAMVAISVSANAQANYWNFGGAFMDCNTGSATTLSGTPYTQYLFESDAASFLIPGLCNTYCKLSGSGGSNLKINHITEGYSPSIAGFTAGQFNLSPISFEGTFAPGQLKPDGSRNIYSRLSNKISYEGNISATGVVTASPTLLVVDPDPGTEYYDLWSAMEVSSDGRYLLYGGRDAKKLMVTDATYGTTTAYPAPGGGYSRIQGYEYVDIGGGTVRIFISYNSKCAANPSGTGGIGYYTLGFPGTFHNITTFPAGTTATEFGFSEMELAKNGKLYLARNAGGNYNFSNPGTVYAITTSGAWAWTTTSFSVPAASNMTYGAQCNKYYIQTQIDGENYNFGTYTGPNTVYATTRLNGLGALSAFPNPSTPIFYNCGTDPIVLSTQVNGLMDRYVITVTSGTIPAGTTTFVPTAGMSVSTTLYGYSNAISVNLLSFVPASYIGTDWKIEITPKNECAIGPTMNIYSRVRSTETVVDFKMKANACSGSGGNARQTSLPIAAASFTASPCIAGWQGAFSAGIVASTASTIVGTILNHNITIQEVDPSSGVNIGAAILNTTISGSPATNYDFAGPTSGYFYNNYAALAASNRTFRVDLTINTSTCSSTAFSYFRIAAGNPFWKDTDAGAMAESLSKEPVLYPNPATDIVKIDYSNLDANASIELYDNLGKRVFQQNNISTNGINMTHLPSGMYFYNLVSGTEIFHGKLTKN